MSVPLDASVDILRSEMPACETYASALGIRIDCAALVAGSPRITVHFHNRYGDLFPAELEFSGYPDLPPTIEFVEIATGERGLRRLYPDCFHATPCVCARYNRKAYGDRGGPHNEWRLKDWQDATSGASARTDGVIMIISDMHAKISKTSGRLE